MSDERNISLERSTREINRKFNVNESSFRTGVPIQDSLARRIFATREDIEKQRNLLLSNDMKKFEKNKEYLKITSGMFDTYANMYDDLKDLYNDIQNLMSSEDLDENQKEILKKKMLNENEVENLEYYTSKNGYFKDEILPIIKSEFDQCASEIESTIDEKISSSIDKEAIVSDITQISMEKNINYFSRISKTVGYSEYHGDSNYNYPINEIENRFVLNINDDNALPVAFRLHFTCERPWNSGIIKIYLDGNILETKNYEGNRYSYHDIDIVIESSGLHYISICHEETSSDLIHYMQLHKLDEYEFNVYKFLTVRDNGGLLYDFIKDKDIPSVTNKDEYQIFELNNKRQVSLFKIDQDKYNKLSSLTKPTEIIDLIVSNENGDNVMITTKGKENIISRDPITNKASFPFIIKSDPSTIGDIKIANVKSVIRERDKSKQNSVYGQKFMNDDLGYYMKSETVYTGVGKETNVDQSGNFRDDKYITGRIDADVSRMKFIEYGNTGIIEFTGEASNDVVDKWEDETIDRIDRDTIIAVTDQKGHFIFKGHIDQIYEEDNGSITCKDINGVTFNDCKIIRKGDICLIRSVNSNDYGDNDPRNYRKDISEFNEWIYIIKDIESTYDSEKHNTKYSLSLNVLNPLNQNEIYPLNSAYEFYYDNNREYNELVFVGSKVEYAENKFGYVTGIDTEDFTLNIYDLESYSYHKRSFEKFSNKELFKYLKVTGKENSSENNLPDNSKKEIKEIKLNKFSYSSKFGDGSSATYGNDWSLEYLVTFTDNTSVIVYEWGIEYIDPEIENSQYLIKNPTKVGIENSDFILKNLLNEIRRSYFSKNIFIIDQENNKSYLTEDSLLNINDAVGIANYSHESSNVKISCVATDYYIYKIISVSEPNYSDISHKLISSITYKDENDNEITDDIPVEKIIILNKIYCTSTDITSGYSFRRIKSYNDEYLITETGFALHFASSDVTYLTPDSDFAWINTGNSSYPKILPENILYGYIVNDNQSGMIRYRTDDGKIYVGWITSSDITYTGSGSRISNIHGVNITPSSSAWSNTVAVDGYIFTVSELTSIAKDENNVLQANIKNIGSDGTIQTRTVPVSNLIINKNPVIYRNPDTKKTVSYSGEITSTDTTITFGEVTLRKATNTTKYSPSTQNLAWIVTGVATVPKIVTSEIIGGYIDNETQTGRINFIYNGTKYFDYPITIDSIVGKSKIGFCVDKDSNKVVPVYNITSFSRVNASTIKVTDSDNVGHTNYNMVMIGDPVLELTPRYKFNQFMFEPLIITSVTANGVSGVWYNSYQKKNTTESNSNIPLIKIAMPYDGKEFFTSDTEKSTITSIDKNANTVHFTNGASYSYDVFANEDMIKYLYVGTTDKAVKEITKTDWNKFTVKFTDGTTTTNVDRTAILFNEAKALDFDYILTDPTPENLTTSEKCSDRTLCRDEITSYQFSYFGDRIKINSESFNCIWTNESARWVDRDRIYKVEELIGEPFYSDVNDTTVACKEYTNCVNEIVAFAGSVDRDETNDIIIIGYIDRNSYSDRYTYELSYYLLYENKFAIVLDGNNTKRKTITKEAYSTNGSKYIKCNGYGFESSLSLNNIDRSNSFSSMSYLFDNTITHKIIDYEELQTVCYTNNYYVASFYDSRANKYYHNAKIKSFTNLKKHPTIKAFRDVGSDNVNSYNYFHSFNKVVLPYYNDSYENVELIQTGEGWDDMRLIYVPNADYKRNSSYTEFAIIVPSSDSRILKLDNLKPSYSSTGSLVGYTGTNPIYIYETGSEICAIQPGTNSGDYYLKDCNVQLCTATIGAYQVPCKISYKGTEYPLYNAGPIKNSVKNILPISTAYRYINQWRLAENSEVLKDKGNEYVLKTVMSTGVSGPVTNESAWGTFTYDIGYYGLYAQFGATTIPPQP